MEKPYTNYCSVCGKELIAKPIYHCFNISTGKPENSWRYKCPNAKFWNGHTSFKCDEHGDTYSFEI